MVKGRRGAAIPPERYALVTGGSGGIGAAVCERLAREGLRVLVGYHRGEEAAQGVADRIAQGGGYAELLPLDVADGGAVNAALNGWSERHPEGLIEVLVNNAGIRRDGLLVFMDGADWADVLRVNLDSFYHVSRWVIKGMLLYRCGRVVNVASLSGVSGMAGQVNYSAAKGGLIAATKALALEVAPRGVRVNAVAPGFITTAMTEGLEKEGFLERIPLGRFGQPEEVAELVAFLASERSSYITGQVVEISGGVHT